MNALTWLGILVCLSQSAILAGLNLGLFSLSKLELKVEARKGDTRAQRVLKLREDANFLLVTILWANVAVNVLLAMLSNSVLAGVAAFAFSTVAITILAEIIPQAYFTRHALDTAATLSPLLRLYEIILYPVARPSALVLDAWLGGEEVRYFKERDLRRLLWLHVETSSSDIDLVEGLGALNFLELDDVPLSEKGELVHPDSVLRLDFDGARPIFPPIQPTPDDPFLQAVNRSGMSWVVIVDLQGKPRMVLEADEFIRDAIFAPARFNPYRYCHRPILAEDPNTTMGEVIQRFEVRAEHAADDIVDDDVILLWDDQRRIITGTDILGRLLRGITRRSHVPSAQENTGAPGES